MAEDRPTSTVNSEYATPPVSVLALDGVPLEPPRASFFSPGPSIGDNSSRDSRALSAMGPEVDREGSTPAHSTALLPTTKDTEGVEAPFSQHYAPRSVPFYRRPVWLAIALAALVALILIIILPVYFTVIKNNGNSNKLSNNSGSGTSTSNAPNPTSTPINAGATTGGDGSTVFTGNTSFTYRNPFGGYCEFFSLPRNCLRIRAPDGCCMITRLARELSRVSVRSQFLLAMEWPAMDFMG